MNVSIGSQMTPEEIEAYAEQMLAASGLPDSLEGLEPGAKLQLQSMRVNIICQVINACGRPIAKAEQEQMAIMTENMKRGMQPPGTRQGPSPVVLREGAFGGGSEE